MPPAEQVIAFLESLPVVAGLRAGERLELLDFQTRFVRSIYAPLDSDGRRIVRLGALSVARGNGKTGLLAGLSLAHLLGPMAEPYGECFAAAVDRDHAGVAYRMVRAFIENVPWMAARCNVQDFHKRVTDETTQSTWAALTSDARKAHGWAPSFFVADEVAQWRGRALWDGLLTGMGKRKQALGIAISTQAADDHHFLSELLDGKHDASVHVQLHTAPPECALDDRKAWQAANPALGEFRDATELEVAAGRAKRSASFEPAFRQLYLNQRVQAETRFLHLADWQANADAFDPLALEGERCFGGLDLSSTRDLTALALWFPDHGKVLAWHWMPEETLLERAERDAVPYERWADAGWIETTPGRATDRLAIARRLADIRGRYDVQSIGFDRWRFEDLNKLLGDEGIELPMVEFVPGFRSYAPSVDAFEAAVLERRMLFGGNPLLAWQGMNVIVETDPAGNRKPTKAKSTGRIDGIVCAIMAIGIAQREGGRVPDYQLFFV